MVTKNLSFIAFLAATNLIPSVGYTISDSAGVAVDANVAQTNRINAANLPVTPQSRAADNAIMALGAAVPGGVNTANLTAAMAFLGGTPPTPVTENSLRAMLAVQTLAPAIPADAPHAALAQTLQTPEMSLPVTAENLRGLGALEAARLTNPTLEMSPATVIAAVSILAFHAEVTEENLIAMQQLHNLIDARESLDMNVDNFNALKAILNMPMGPQLENITVYKMLRRALPAAEIITERHMKLVKQAPAEGEARAAVIWAMTTGGLSLADDANYPFAIIKVDAVDAKFALFHVLTKIRFITPGGVRGPNYPTQEMGASVDRVTGTGVFRALVSGVPTNAAVGKVFVMRSLGDANVLVGATDIVEIKGAQLVPPEALVAPAR